MADGSETLDRSLEEVRDYVKHKMVEIDDLLNKAKAIERSLKRTNYLSPGAYAALCSVHNRRDLTEDEHFWIGHLCATYQYSNGYKDPRFDEDMIADANLEKANEREERMQEDRGWNEH